MKFLCFPLDICPANGSVLVIQEMASNITGPQISLSLSFSLSFTHRQTQTHRHTHIHSCVSWVGKSEDTIEEKCSGFFFFLIFQVLVKSVSLTCHPFPPHTPRPGFSLLVPLSAFSGCSVSELCQFWFHLSKMDVFCRKDVRWACLPGSPIWFSKRLSIPPVCYCCSVVSDSLQPHGLQHARLPCPAPSLVQFSRSVVSDSLRPQHTRPPVHHQLPEFTQTHVHRIGDALQQSHPLWSPSPLAFALSQQ